MTRPWLPPGEVPLFSPPHITDNLGPININTLEYPALPLLPDAQDASCMASLSRSLELVTALIPRLLIAVSERLYMYMVCYRGLYINNLCKDGSTIFKSWFLAESPDKECTH
jgi:hypothetical protein